MEERCGNCYFSRPLEDDAKGVICQRFPPAVYNVEYSDRGARVVSHHPLPHIDHWCGEWRASREVNDTHDGLKPSTIHDTRTTWRKKRQAA